MKITEVLNGRQVSLDQGHQPQFLVGLDSQKNANPGKGDTYYAYDTGRQLTCFVNGVWSVVSSPSTIRTGNHEGTVTNFFKTAVVGAPDVTTLTSNHALSMDPNSAGDSVEYYTDVFYTPDNFTFLASFFIYAVNLGSAAPNGHEVRIGLHDRLGIDGNASAQAMFMVNSNDGQWKCVTSDGGGGHTQVTNISAPSFPGSSFSVYTSPGNGFTLVIYTMNGVIVAVHTNILLPVVNLVSDSYITALSAPTVFATLQTSFIGLDILT
ncbi:Uncharacterised protein [uncultured archaeon]|nr:Uncharacterised protein [uncultured archaeon]